VTGLVFGKHMVEEIDRDLYMLRGRIMFPNGFGASVIMGRHSYGGPPGLWEVAVFAEKGIRYDTGITDDVIGHLTSEGVADVLSLIEQLP